MKFKFKMLTFIGLAALSMTLMAGDKGPTVVVKKDERRIAGLNTNGITRWTANVGQEGDEVTAVNQIIKCLNICFKIPLKRMCFFV